MKRMKRFGILIFMFLALLLVAFPVMAQDDATSEPTPQATEVSTVGEFDQQLNTAEGLAINAIERLASAALDRQATWAIVVFLGGGVAFTIAMYLLWNSEPKRRNDIKTSALNVVGKAEDEITKRAEAAKLTPDPFDDLRYQSLLAAIQAIEKRIEHIPTSPPDKGVVIEPASQLIVRGFGES